MESSVLGELFGAESKSQVDRHLHAYLSENKSSTQSLSITLLFLSWFPKYVYIYILQIRCYDDACHLHKYTTRSSLISTALVALVAL